MARSFTDAFRKAFARITGVKEPKHQKPPSAWERTKKIVGDFRETVSRALPSRKKAVKNAQFDIESHADPAFFSWVNRAARNLNVNPKPGETLTEARMRALMKKLGAKTKLDLYEMVKNNPDFGYAEYQDAYDKYGKAVSSKENPYSLNNSIELAFQFDLLAREGSVYETLGAVR